MMPIMEKLTNYQQMVGDLERAVDRPAYILTGEESFLIRGISGRLTSSLVAKGAETIDRVVMDGDGKFSSIDLAQLLAEMSTPPFLSRRKTIYLNKTGFFAGALPAGDGIVKDLEHALTNIPAHCCLVFVEESLVSNNRLLRQMLRSGAIGAKITRQPMGELLKWVSGLCRREGLRITRDAAESLVLRCEYSMSDLMNELSTVFLYYHFTGGQNITLKDIDFLCREDLTGKIFDLTDAIASGRIDEALRKLDTLLERREPPLYIQTMLARQARDLVIAKECKTNSRIIESGVTQSNFYASKLSSQAKRFSLPQLEQMIERAFQADWAIKTGKLDGEDALTVQVIRSCGAL
ncbi:MAG TPA: DNA polymerase III subunit delta [Clostridia bacterium]|nr:DNA polymerase III subunit delta [Clostridia bacterium]